MRIFTCIAIAFCALLASCDTVNYDPATSDTSPPGVNVLIKRAGLPDLEVQGQTGAARPVGNYGNLPPTPTRFEFSVLATGTDNESGIRHIKLSMTRTVCYLTSGGAIAQAYSGTVMRKEANYTDRRNAPTQTSLGDTGVIDTTPNALGKENLLAWTNANGQTRIGIGVSSRWNMEATNFAGQTTFSNSILIAAGDTSCVTSP